MLKQKQTEELLIIGYSYLSRIHSLSTEHRNALYTKRSTSEINKYKQELENEIDAQKKQVILLISELMSRPYNMDINNFMYKCCQN
jgi:hypothetical protein